MKRQVLTAALTVAALLLPAGAMAEGALAIDSNQGSRWGFAYDYSSMSEAMSRAVRECGQGCSVVKTFSHGCAAYAADQSAGSTIYGWATASNASAARGSALSYCNQHGGRSCVVRSWGCNSN